MPEITFADSGVEIQMTLTHDAKITGTDGYTWIETQVGNQVNYRPSVTISHKNLTADIP